MYISLVCLFMYGTHFFFKINKEVRDKVVQRRSACPRRSTDTVITFSKRFGYYERIYLFKLLF